jgi:hypothetical protein
MDQSSGESTATDEWENEGGTTLAQIPQLPDGIVVVTATHYIVGPYRYTSLEDALAEHRRQSSGRAS